MITDLFAQTIVNSQSDSVTRTAGRARARRRVRTAVAALLHFWSSHRNLVCVRRMLSLFRASLLPSRSLFQTSVRFASAKAAGLQSSVCSVLGSQWGDEGKGKLVDILASK